jgi:uncharacterized membrane protein
VTLIALAFLLGVVTGARTFTAAAALMVALQHWTVGIILALLAAGEYVGDLMPTAGSRTSAGALAARLVASAFVGAAAMPEQTSARIGGAIAGMIGALIGAFGGLRVRVAAIARIGAVPAALTEDVIALGVAIAVASAVAHLR